MLSLIGNKFDGTLLQKKLIKIKDIDFGLSICIVFLGPFFSFFFSVHLDVG